MKLLTKEILKKLPKLHEGNGVAQVKFFTPWGGWTWFATEYDPEERVFYGFVEGLDSEWGYFSLDELESIRGPLGLGIERDMWFTPKRVGHEEDVE